MRDRNVCILGMGRVGLTLAVVLAENGFYVNGVDADPGVIDSLLRDTPHFFELNLAKRLEAVRRGEHFVVSCHMPTLDSLNAYYIMPVRPKAWIITVGTPIDAEQRPDLLAVTRAARQVADSLKTGDLVIVRSTVPIGTTRAVVKPILDGAGRQYDLAACPERTVEGAALEELCSLPQVVGGINEQAAVRAAMLFECITKITKVSSLEAAEAVKLLDNVQRDARFALANEVARVCDAVGLSANEVARAAGAGYARWQVGKPGPVGGVCLEKDTWLLQAGLGYETAPISRIARRQNKSLVRNTFHHIAALADKIGLPPNPIVAVLGLAFKGCPETDDTRGSPAFDIIQEIRDRWERAYIRGCDPAVPDERIAAEFMVRPMPMRHVFEAADLVIVASNRDWFSTSASLAFASLEMARPSLIFDFWNNVPVDLAMSGLPEGIVYTGLGEIGKTRKGEGR